MRSGEMESPGGRRRVLGLPEILTHLTDQLQSPGLVVRAGSFQLMIEQRHLQTDFKEKTEHLTSPAVCYDRPGPDHLQSGHTGHRYR